MERAEKFALYLVENKSTIRKSADVFGVSKSTFHNDVSNKLKNINKYLYAEVKKILDENFKEKHIRGGESTKKKYLIIKLNNKNSF